MPRLANAYGYFDEDAREYVITRPDTPTPWINYLGEGRYGGIISNTAGGYSFDRDPRNRRVTRYRYNGVPMDQPGRYIYLRDMQTGEFWSPTWSPVHQRKLEGYECRHGAGYTRIASSFNGIAASVLYFVPLAGPQEPAPCEVWVLRLRNDSERSRSLRSFTYAELSYPDTMIDQTNLDWGQQIVFSRLEAGVIYTGTKFLPSTTFFASSQPACGFDTQRESFIGRWRDLSNPAVVESGQPGNSLASRGNNIASLCHEWRLEPGEESELIFILGVSDQPERIAPVLERYRQAKEVQAAFASLQADWKRYFSNFQVETPDAATNAMLNFWNPLQCRTTLYWSRFVSAYESGMGRGMGTRDTAQDTLGTVHTLPERARQSLNMVWKLQFQDGHAWHQVYPLTGEGGAGLASEIPDWPQWFCDDHLWMVMAACAYLRETGDFAYLDERVPFTDGGDGSIWEHMQMAIQFTLDHRGPHGLPRTGFSDWDDTMNIDHGSGKAESVWCGQQFCKALLDLAELCFFLGKEAEARKYRALQEEMAAAVNQDGWDGDWFRRAYDDDGNPMGCKGAATNEIALIPQAWAVIGEVAPRERLERAMWSMHQHLNTQFGLALMDPPYNGSDPHVRGTSTYIPGLKENGGIFCHANTFAMVAAAKLGQGDLAYQYYTQVNPLLRQDLDHYLVEPYVYSQNVAGPRHPLFGQGRNAWLTGTASWTYVAGTQWILGIRPTYRGLQIAPVLPSTWNGYSAERVFRGVRYLITVEQKGHSGLLEMSVDGKEVFGNVIPLPAPEVKEVRVSVKLL
jgi:cellobiose phosphorylase